MLSHFQTKGISFSKHETQTFILVLWVEVTHSLPFHSLNLNCMGAIHLKSFQFSLSFISELTKDSEQLTFSLEQP